MPCSFRDETSTTTAMGAGSSGSWEFGSATPSTTGGVVSVDGVLLNTTSGFFLANGLAPSSSLNRVTGSVIMPAPQGNTISVDTSSKSDWTVISGSAQNQNVMIKTLGTTSIIFENIDPNSVSYTLTYSWI